MKHADLLGAMKSNCATRMRNGIIATYRQTLSTCFMSEKKAKIHSWIISGVLIFSCVERLAFDVIDIAHSRAEKIICEFVEIQWRIYQKLEA